MRCACCQLALGLFWAPIYIYRERERERELTEFVSWPPCIFSDTQSTLRCSQSFFHLQFLMAKKHYVSLLCWSDCCNKSYDIVLMCAVPINGMHTHTHTHTLRQSPFPQAQVPLPPSPLFTSACLRAANRHTAHFFHSHLDPWVDTWQLQTLTIKSFVTM